MTLDGRSETVTFQASLELGNREKYAGLTLGLYGGCRKVATPIWASRRPQRRQCGLERCRGGAFNDRHSPVVSVSSSVKALKDFVEHSVVGLSWRCKFFVDHPTLVKKDNEHCLYLGLGYSRFFGGKVRGVPLRTLELCFGVVLEHP